MPEGFDVFLNHNSRDKPVVEEICTWLEAQGLRVWLDKKEFRPGFPWQESLEEGIQTSRAVAVCIGFDGLGPWQEPEARAFIAQSRREKIPVIPVLLPGCPESSQLTLFLQAFAWVDLREGLTEAGLARLVWGITGKRPDGTVAPRVKPSKSLRTWWNWGIAISLLGLAVTLAAWLRPLPPTSPPQPGKPRIYAVRVQVLDPQGQPIEGAKVCTSTNNEPHLLLDGLWEVEIPSGNVPKNGRVSFWANHPSWTENQVSLFLGDDPNPRVEIHLKMPETWIRGRVEAQQILAGLRISRSDGAHGQAVTDAQGRFEFRLSRPSRTRIRLRAEKNGVELGNNFCYTNDDNCSIVLEKR